MFPLLLMVSEALDPLPRESDAAVLFDGAVAHSDALTTSALLLLASSLFMVPAVFGLAQTIQARGAGLTHAGVLFGVMGAVGHAAAAVYYLIVAAMVDGEREQMVALLERIDESAAAGVVFILILSFAVSLLTMAFGAWRSGVASVAVPAAIVAAVVLEIASPAFPESFAVVKQALVLGSFGWLGIRVLRMGDADWANPEPVVSAARATAAGQLRAA